MLRQSLAARARSFSLKQRQPSAAMTSRYIIHHHLAGGWIQQSALDSSPSATTHEPARLNSTDASNSGVPRQRATSLNLRHALVDRVNAGRVLTVTKGRDKRRLAEAGWCRAWLSLTRLVSVNRPAEINISTGGRPGTNSGDVFQIVGVFLCINFQAFICSVVMCVKTVYVPGGWVARMTHYRRRRCLN